LTVACAGGLLSIRDQSRPSEEGRACGPAARNEETQEEAEDPLASAKGFEVELRAEELAAELADATKLSRSP
jgi:hypothetical protein